MDEGKHYILLPVSKIGIFRDHVAPPDFAENTDMAKDLDYKTGLDFWGLFWGKKSPSYRRINTVLITTRMLIGLSHQHWLVEIK